MSDSEDSDEEEAFVDVINLLNSDALNYGDQPLVVSDFDVLQKFATSTNRNIRDCFQEFVCVCL
jgi:hypothetical protein